jgi:hypothetical protein
MPSLARGRLAEFFASFHRRLDEEAANDPEPDERFSLECYGWPRRRQTNRTRQTPPAEQLPPEALCCEIDVLPSCACIRCSPESWPTAKASVQPLWSGRRWLQARSREVLSR